MASEIIDPCVYCGNSTAFGFGRFVNRLPVDDGWGCAECSGFPCDKCDKQIYLDEDVSWRGGWYHETCLKEVKKEDREKAINNGNAIWLTDEEAEVLGGFVAELLDRQELDNYQINILENVYNQLEKE